MLEDAAQAIGGALGDERAGSMGDAATFSFFPTKNLPCFGDGGLVTTNSAEVAETCRVLRFHGSRDKRDFERIGFNSRLDTIQAAVLLELLPLLDGWNDHRIAAAARYAELGLGELVDAARGRRPARATSTTSTSAAARTATSSRPPCASAGIASASYYAKAAAPAAGLRLPRRARGLAARDRAPPRARTSPCRCPPRSARTRR